MSLSTTHLGKYHRFTARMGGDNNVYMQPGANEKLNIDMNGGILSNAITSGSASQLFTSITTTDLLATNILTTNLTTTNLNVSSVSLTGTETITNAGNATNVSSGGLIVSGGIGVTGDVYMNGNFYNTNQIAYVAKNDSIVTLSPSVSKYLSFNSTVLNQGPSGKSITFDGTQFTCRSAGLYALSAGFTVGDTPGTAGFIAITLNNSTIGPLVKEGFNTNFNTTYSTSRFLSVATVTYLNNNDTFYANPQFNILPNTYTLNITDIYFAAAKIS